MEYSVDPEDVELLLTATERQALRVALLPRGVRGVMDAANQTTPQSRYNARRRAAKRLAAAKSIPTS